MIGTASLAGEMLLERGVDTERTSDFFEGVWMRATLCTHAMTSL